MMLDILMHDTPMSCASQSRLGHIPLPAEERLHWPAKVVVNFKEKKLPAHVRQCGSCKGPLISAAFIGPAGEWPLCAMCLSVRTITRPQKGSKRSKQQAVTDLEPPETLFFSTRHQAVAAGLL